jgi:hypothetical protein
MQEDSNNLLPLLYSWMAICKRGLTKILESEWLIIKQFGNAVFIPKTSIVYSTNNNLNYIDARLFRFRGSDNTHRFFVLLEGSEKYGISPYYIYILLNLWKIEQGMLPVHASAIVRKGKLYLFAGPSGAGKSTIASLSLDVGGKVLDEDQVTIYPMEDGRRFIADAWGYSLSSCNVPIGAIFSIYQSQNDKLLPLSQINVARLLLERFLDIMTESLPSHLVSHAFSFVANIARHVPGYELYFRKNPEFWNLIDEKFPG